MSDTQDPFGFFEACGITPKKRKRFHPHSVILAGAITYMRSGRYRLGNMARGRDEMMTLEREPFNFTIPIYTYIHGVTLQSTRSWVGRAHHADWDSGRSGYWFIPTREIRRMGFVLTQKRKELLASTLDAILTIIHDPDTDPDDEYVEWFNKAQ